MRREWHASRLTLPSRDTHWLLRIRLGDQEIFFPSLPALRCRHHPARHPPAASPSISRFVAILDRDLPFALAAVEEVTKVKASLLDDSHELLLYGRPLRALLLDFRPLNAGLHCG